MPIGTEVAALGFSSDVPAQHEEEVGVVFQLGVDHVAIRAEDVAGGEQVMGNDDGAAVTIGF